MKDTDKVTLTVGQLKRLINESYDSDGFIWTLNKLGRGKVNFIKDSDTIFDTADEALEDGMTELEKCPDGDYFEILVTRPGMPTNNYRNIVKRANKTKSGHTNAFGLNGKNIGNIEIDGPVYVYSIHEIIGGRGPDAGNLGGPVYSNYQDEFETPEEALDDALNYLKKYTRTEKYIFYPIVFQIEIRDYTTSSLKARNYYNVKFVGPDEVKTVKPVKIGIE